MTRFNQKGSVPFLALIIVGVAVVGGVLLFSRNSKQTNKSSTTPQESRTDATVPVTDKSIQWTTYKDSERGYSIKHPEGWTVENSTANNSRIINVKAADKSAFVIIEAIVGPKLDEKGVEEVVKYFEDKLKNDQKYKTINFAQKTDNGTGGFIAEGEYVAEENTPEEQKIVFEERFMVAQNGRGLRTHAAYSKLTEEINKSVTAKIIGSLSTN